MSLSKNEVQSIIVSHLKQNPKTQIASLRGSVESVLRERGVIGEMTKGNQFLRTTWTEKISNEDALLINEVIYDLLYSRVITPGTNKDNLDLPWIHVSDEDKLNNLE